MTMPAETVVVTKDNPLDFPADYAVYGTPECVIPLRAINWLITTNALYTEELINHRIGYSQSRDLLIFPIYGANNDLLMWQGRYFGDNPNHPKWKTYGNVKDILHIIKPSRGSNYANTIILVEDIVSAIKVGRIYHAAPLFGSVVHPEFVQRLRKIYDNLGIWLDFDKKKESIKAAIRYSTSMNTFVISTACDPKLYASHALSQFIYTAMQDMVPKTISPTRASKHMEQIECR